MTYNSKRNIVSMAAGIVLIAAYIVYAATGSSPAPEDIRAWAKLMLIFIGVSVGVHIVIQIHFHIALAIGIAVKEKECGDNRIERIISSSVMEDEREQLISLKSSRIGHIGAGVGSLIAIIAIACGASVVIALHIIVGSFAAGSVLEGGAGIFLHERGVRNGR